MLIFALSCKPVYYGADQTNLRSTRISNLGGPYLEKFREGIVLFNAGEFFKAHEVWEELWLAAAEPEKTFLQGLIQCAAAFHHYTRGNRNGARSLLAVAVEKLDKFPGNHCGMNLFALRAAAAEFLNAPVNRPACVPLPLPRIQQL